MFTCNVPVGPQPWAIGRHHARNGGSPVQRRSPGASQRDADLPAAPQQGAQPADRRGHTHRDSAKVCRVSDEL